VLLAISLLFGGGSSLAACFLYDFAFSCVVVRKFGNRFSERQKVLNFLNTAVDQVTIEKRAPRVIEAIASQIIFDTCDRT
jgi:hypothetical protein